MENLKWDKNVCKIRIQLSNVNAVKCSCLINTACINTCVDIYLMAL